MPIAIDNTRTNQVRLAAQQLQAALNAPEGRRESEIRAAREWLTAAANDHENDAAQLRRGFLAEPSASEPAVAPADVMSIIISDLYVGNTLMAAGNALEESEAKPNPALLDQALLGIQQGDSASREVAAYGFVSEPVHSTHLAAARDTFGQRTEEVLNDLIRQAKETCSNVVAALKKVDGQGALDALGRMGGPLAELPKLGVLFQKGMEKVQNALDFLKRMLDSSGLSEVKEKLTALWSKIMDGSWADELLGWMWNREAVESMVPKAMSSDKLTPEKIDRATGDLAPLTEKFGSEMNWARSATASVSFSSGLILLAGVTAGTAALFVGGAYLLILAAVIIIGRDCAGSGEYFHGNRGVRSIIEALITA